MSSSELSSNKHQVYKYNCHFVEELMDFFFKDPSISQTAFFAFTNSKCSVNGATILRVTSSPNLGDILYSNTFLKPHILITKITRSNF